MSQSTIARSTLLQQKKDTIVSKHGIPKELNKKSRLNGDHQMRLNIEYINEEYSFSEGNYDDWRKYYSSLADGDENLIPSDEIYTKHKKFWSDHNNSWFDVLDIKDKFYSYEELIKILAEKKIETVKEFRHLCRNDNRIPKDVVEAYRFDVEYLLKESSIVAKLSGKKSERMIY